MKKLFLFIGGLFLLAAVGLYAADITELTGVTGQVGQEDIHYGTGQSTDTFSITGYSGASVTLTAVPSPNADQASILKEVWWVSNAATILDHGDDTYAGSLAWVVDQAGTDETDIILPGTSTYTVSTDLAIPSTITVRAMTGAQISVDSGKTLAIAGQVIAPNAQIFTGSGTTTVAGYPQNDAWWGNAAGWLLEASGSTVKIPFADLVTATGDLVYYDGSKLAPIAIGTDQQRLITSGSEITWDTLAIADVTNLDTSIAADGSIKTGLDLDLSASSDYLFPVRSSFTYSATDAVVIGPGVYFMPASGEMVYSDSSITYTFSSLAASDWIYLYLDASVVAASGTEVTGAGFFMDTATEPQVSSNLHGWYNGSDRCLFAVRTNASAHVVEFYQSGDFVLFADQQVTNITNTDVDTTWLDCTLTIPIFTRLAQITARGEWAAGSYQYWRTNGASGTVGHLLNYLTASSSRGVNTTQVVTDADGVIEVVHTVSNADTLTVTLDGWYLPGEM